MTKSAPAQLSALAIASGSKRSRRKLALLNAAIELFAEHGYDRVTIREIGDRLGMTSASLYRHYDGKAALLADAVDLVIHPMIEELDRIAATPATPRQRLAEAIEFHAQFALDHRTYLRVYYLESRHLSQEARTAHRKFADQYRDRWVRLILESHAAETAEEARTVYALAMAMLNMGSSSAVVRNRSQALRTLVDRTLQMLLGSPSSE